MLRIHFLQQWYGLADGAMEDALYDSQALRGFAGIDLTVAGVPEETTILNFRHWLERHELSQALFAEVSAMLEERGLLMRHGTIVDATIIAAPSSTKNKSKARDPEMHQTKKGNQWHFGMKAHIGVDVASGLVHTVKGTAANEADITQMAAVLHGQESDIFADAGYTGADKRPELEDRDVSWNIAIKRSIIKLSIYQFIRHLQSFGSGRHSRRSLMARRRPRVNQESLPRASLAGWRSGRFFRQGRDCWRGPTCRSRPPNRGREP